MLLCSCKVPGKVSIQHSSIQAANTHTHPFHNNHLHQTTRALLETNLSDACRMIQIWCTTSEAGFIWSRSPGPSGTRTDQYKLLFLQSTTSTVSKSSKYSRYFTFENAKCNLKNLLLFFIYIIICIYFHILCILQNGPRLPKHVQN